MTSTVGAALRPAPIPTASTLRGDPVVQAFTLLRIAFTVAPILFGLDKFAGVLTDDWTRYLAPAFNDIIPGSAADAMHIVGVDRDRRRADRRDRAALRRPARRRLARRHHRQPADRRRLRRHRAARLRPDARRAHAGAAGERGPRAADGGYGANCALRGSPEGCGGAGIAGCACLSRDSSHELGAPGRIHPPAGTTHSLTSRR